MPLKFGFDQEIATSRSPDALWNTMERALEDSERVPEWPNRFSSLKDRRDGTLDATYRGLGTESTYRYDLNVSAAERTFRYDAVPGMHPFAGGATVSVTPTERGSTLVWKGAYEAGLRQLPQALAFKLVFEPLFFHSLRRGLND
ncbi:MAG: SRPBCC family protein [Myxococcota bacterium]